MERRITFYGNYFSKFYKKQNTKTRDKIDYVIDIIRFLDRVPIQFLKHLKGTNGLYENELPRRKQRGILKQR